ncbi:MarR family winged helix-turn-helix transcriptional regulator [Phocoenobacter skyensis]|uniref:DNA-binding transcriptional regulator, MarR family n=1 Tax=Phocoenobacter skyensis TaxID=97481 RepID=A0A1H7YDY6_9PAST|nr:MarR family transcriptional regulator [Pasteurella skyensis]MDP8079734.1 MarR family transcriptional regulator [Pasteurella skyensis]MDP8085691.1 MarR family transcriptional regulator [Pasteurella skyensis]MDP8175188.1 MarR family transcriptional regulator [Pasteurella skyensis]MDP8185460.1 MarR family transcriptional regulator [Pasteurella skyensis]QLB22293.1 MarR family transcriptional regulator [Pasteurella skyensis]
MNKVFSVDTPSESTGFLLWKTTNLWQREIKRALVKYDLTHTQFVILASVYWLSTTHKDVTQVEIANFIDIDKMMTSNVIRKLIDKEFIIRKEHHIDTRAKVVQLTDKGVDVLKKSVVEVERFDHLFFGKVSDQSKFNSELIRLLNK